MIMTLLLSEVKCILDFAEETGKTTEEQKSVESNKDIYVESKILKNSSASVMKKKLNSLHVADNYESSEYVNHVINMKSDIGALSLVSKAAAESGKIEKKLFIGFNSEEKYMANQSFEKSKQMFNKILSQEENVTSENGDKCLVDLRKDIKPLLSDVDIDVLDNKKPMFGATIGSECMSMNSKNGNAVEETSEIELTMTPSSETDSVTSKTTTAQCSPVDENEDSVDFAHPISPTSYHISAINDNKNSNVSTCSSNENNELLSLPQEIIEEEHKLALETELEITNHLKNVVQLDTKEKEKRYKTLMNLLGKSNQYASYMSQKLAEQKETDVLKESDTLQCNEEESPKILQNTTNRVGKRKRGASSSKSKEAKKAKLESDEVSYNPKTHYKNKMGFIVSRRQPQTLIGGIMRDYQLDGLEWMVSLYKNGVNGILADEMGLGKTIQTIALLCHLREKNIFGPHLIVAPLSTLPNWMCEFANFAPDIPVMLYHGPAEKRDEAKKEFVKIMMSKDRSKLPVVLTSYEVPLRDHKFLQAIKWCYSIVDEGHRLKNYKSMLSQVLRTYKTETRLLLTGTPLQNNLSELWSLLNYLIPEIFDDLPLFENLFDFSDLTDSDKKNQLIEKEKEEQIVSKMHQILEPFLLRRVKTDVKISIPRKKEILVYAPLTVEQEELYKSVLDRTILETARPEKDKSADSTDGKRKRKCRTNLSYSEDWDMDKNVEFMPKEILLLKKSGRKRITSRDVDFVYNLKFNFPDMMLRKIVNHPYLVKTPVYPGTRDIIINEDLIQQSGKLLVLDALLPRLKKEGHKVLIFSTFRIMLDLLEDYVIMRQHKYVRLDGLNKIEERLESIKQFNSDLETFIFLISTHAGGLGINLTAADTVIIYDSDWNPQVDLQAQDRCHRIGQTRPVIVYRLVTAGTVDERITNRATSKRRLEKLVMKRGKFKQQAQNKEEISLTELKELLESTDYKQVIYPNGLVMSDEQIEALLDRQDLLHDEQIKPVENGNSKY